MTAPESKKPGTLPPGTTPSQTIGPFHRIMVPWERGGTLTSRGDPAAILIRGHIYDGQDNAVDDCVLETWQANVHGRYAHPDDTREIPLVKGFEGFGRVITDKDGRFELLTVKPGCVPGPNGSVQAPHVSLSLFARGLLKRLATRMYFADERAANEKDPILQSIGDTTRRETLIATRQPGPATPPVYAFVIHLQGNNETVFFDI